MPRSARMPPLMPLLLLLRKLRLPTRGEAELIGIIAFVLLFASWLRRGEAIKTRDAVIAAKPTIEERIVEKRIEGPVRVVEKIIKSADGACSIERVTERGPVVIERAAEHTERPVCASTIAVKTWAVGGALDLQRRDRGSAGISKSFGNISFGFSHDLGVGAHLGDVNGTLSLRLF